ncbi:methylmalonyl-CoA mutase [Candidatus Acetothermia bacterium]|nr:methylmalonyl-CoA mutase [Candidatus Acetothermia bacterium]MBI3642785.1 methylmalonyl-CoA mutase [Candidatus Acetothermia bacterium]
MPDQKRDERRERFLTDSQIEQEPFYSSTNPRAQDSLGFPGEFPFTRGVYPSMYRGRLWTMRQYAGFGTAEETNQRYRYLISQGQMGLSVAFDLPTQMGYDSDHPMAEGEVGKAGVAVPSLHEMEQLFEEIPLERISTSMTINAPAAILLAMYIATGEKQDISQEKLSGTIQNDILKEYIARKTYIFPLKFSMRLVTDAIMYCAKNVPRWNAISISGYHMREAGATAVQEITFTLANAIAYVEAVLKRGFNVDEFAPQLSFFFSCDRHFFEEVAKFRAARRLWARLMRVRFNAKNPESLKLRFHTQTGGSTLTAQQPLNNIIRTSIEALAAVLGGTQSLHTNSYDEALALPTEQAVLIGLRTQQIIAEESGAADTIDPFGGSYYIESLTDTLEEQALQLMEKIDSMGGMLGAIESGYVQREIEDSAYRKQLEVESGERQIVGVNLYKEDDARQAEILKVAAEVRERSIQQLKEMRSRRDRQRCEQSLDKLRGAARADENLLPHLITAVKAYATVGEICDLFRKEFGVYEEPGL